jgi:hypothetical protein
MRETNDAWARRKLRELLLELVSGYLRHEAQERLDAIERLKRRLA